MSVFGNKSSKDPAGRSVRAAQLFGLAAEICDGDPTAFADLMADVQAVYAIRVQAVGSRLDASEAAE